LLNEEHRDEAENRLIIGEETHSASATFDLTIEPFNQVCRVNLAVMSLWELQISQQVINPIIDEG